MYRCACVHVCVRVSITVHVYSTFSSRSPSCVTSVAPTAALFFFTYETSKHFLTPIFHATPSPSSSSSSTAGGVNPLVHCFSACLGETVACLIRVPTENVKQKVQAGMYRSSWECFRALIAASPAAASSSASSSSIGVASNFYRGFGSTILREIPFALIQFPLYEWSKWRVDEWRRARDGPDARPIDGWQCALVGSLSGGVAAAATTPLDVVKTRLILERVGTGRASLGVVGTFRSVYSEGGVRALFAGVVPRVLWISLGGGVFFGAYEASKRKLETIL